MILADQMVYFLSKRLYTSVANFLILLSNNNRVPMQGNKIHASCKKTHMYRVQSGLPIGGWGGN